MRRWSNMANLATDWDSRTRQMAGLVRPGTSVVEFGAGRQVLKDCLPESCSYTATDLIEREAGMLVCDLNGKTLPSLGDFDVAVLSGVLEYVRDVPRLATYLSTCVDEVLVSYAVAEKTTRGRRGHGWVNDYDTEQLRAVFETAGFRCGLVEDWTNQKIFRFTRERGTAREQEGARTGVHRRPPNS